MPTKQVRLREDHYEFIKGQPVSLSAVVRGAIDAAIDGDRTLTQENHRSTTGQGLVRTTVNINDEHDVYLDTEEIVFAVLVHQLIQERIERHRKLEKLEAAYAEPAERRHVPDAAWEWYDEWFEGGKW